LEDILSASPEGGVQIDANKTAGTIGIDNLFLHKWCMNMQRVKERKINLNVGIRLGAETPRERRHHLSKGPDL
jgi:hypothetical protein